MEQAARNGDLEAVIKYHNEGQICYEGAMHEATKAGHLEIIKWIHYNITTIRYTTFLMNKVAELGYLDIVKFLHLYRGKRLV